VDAFQMSSWSVSGMFHRKEASGQTQDQLGKLKMSNFEMKVGPEMLEEVVHESGSQDLCSVSGSVAPVT